MTDQKEESLKITIGTPSSHHPDILPKKKSRRSTILVRPQNQSEPPIENPKNSSDVNEQLKTEYKTIQSLNKVLEIISEDFDNASQEIHHFSKSLDQTDKLLDLWLSVLERAEDIKSVLEDGNWHNAEKRANAVLHNDVEKRGDENNRKRRAKEY